MLSKKSGFQLFVRLPNGNGTSLIVHSQITCLDLTKLLTRTSLQLPATYRLIFKGNPVKNYNDTLSQCGVQAGSIIHIHSQPEIKHKRSKVDVAFLLNGDKFVINHSTCETVWSLKVAISELTHISPKEQVLVFMGKRLKNNKTLELYKISSDSLLSLITQPIESHVQDRDVQGSSQADLVNSLCSFGDKKTGLSMSAMFRSDSLNKRHIEQKVPYAVTIQQKNNECFLPIRKDFHQLFNSCREDNLKESLTFDNNLFESAKLLNLQPRIELDSEEQCDLPNLQQCQLVESINE